MRIEMMTLSRASCDVLHINNEWPHSIHFIPPKSHVRAPICGARTRTLSPLLTSEWPSSLPRRRGRGGRAEQIGASASGVVIRDFGGYILSCNVLFFVRVTVGVSLFVNNPSQTQVSKKVRSSTPASDSRREGVSMLPQPDANFALRLSDVRRAAGVAARLRRRRRRDVTSSTQSPESRPFG